MANINIKSILYFLGVLLIFNGIFMMLPIAVSLIYGEAEFLSLLTASLTTLLLGGFLVFMFKNHNPKIQKREGYLIVSLGWLTMILSGMLPYLYTGTFNSIADAFFETTSGFTTTGASIINDVEALPKGVLFWRSITQWIGGMGIIVLTVAILPFFGMGGVQLFTAESTVPNSDKLRPRISSTARRLWWTYFGLTLLLCFGLWSFEMSFFDAINHAMTTLSTGGFSTKNASLAFWNNSPGIQYLVILFMFLAGINFVLLYHLIRGRIMRLFADAEFKFYSLSILVFSILISCGIYFQVDLHTDSLAHPEIFGKAESTFRNVLFQIVSIVTTTGFVTANYSLWPHYVTMLFLILFMFGGMTGSTSGGIKSARILILGKKGWLQFKKLLHPNAVVQPRYNGKLVSPDLMEKISNFFIIFLITFLIGAIVFSAMGFDHISALSISASSLGNVGPALGKFGPIENYSDLNSFGRLWSSFLMIAGRLELYTVLILSSPYFWKSNY